MGFWINDDGKEEQSIMGYANKKQVGRENWFPATWSSDNTNLCVMALWVIVFFRLFRWFQRFNTAHGGCRWFGAWQARSGLVCFGAKSELQSFGVGMCYLPHVFVATSIPAACPRPHFSGCRFCCRVSCLPGWVRKRPPCRPSVTPADVRIISERLVGKPMP